MSGIFYSTDERKAIAHAILHIAILVEQNHRDEQRLRACRKAERKEHSSIAMPISALAKDHDQCVIMTLLGATHSSKADLPLLRSGDNAHQAARKRWFATF
jgi:hypothetical protein